MVGVHVVLVGMHERGYLFDQRGADGVGALGLLRPVHPRLQRNLAGAGQKVVIADRVDDGAGGIAQHHHVLGVDDLLIEHLHHRRGMFVQAQVALAGQRQVGSAHRRVVGPLDARHPQRGTALVRLVDRIDMLGTQLQAGGDGPRRLVAATPHADLTKSRMKRTSHAVVSRRRVGRLVGLLLCRCPVLPGGLSEADTRWTSLGRLRRSVTHCKTRAEPIATSRHTLSCCRRLW